MAGRMINGAAALAELVRPARNDDRFGAHRVLPVVPELSNLLPGRGLRRGTTVAVAAPSPDPALPSPVLPSSALPSSALPSSALPSPASSAPSAPSRPAASGPASSTSSAPVSSSAPSLSAGRSPSSVARPATRSSSRPLSTEPGSLSAVPGSLSAVPGSLSTVPGSLSAVPGSLSAVPGSPSAVPGSLSAVPDEPAGAPGNGGTSLLLALLSAASRSGSWCAVVGVPALGVLAAAESGIALDRLVLVPNPGPDWPTVVAALIDGVDVVVMAVPGSVPATLAGRLAPRARPRGRGRVPCGRGPGAAVTLAGPQGRLEGLGEGRGRLRRRRVTVLARGRGAAARPREITLWMPGTVVPPEPVPPGRISPPSTVGGGHRLVAVPDPERAGEQRDGEGAMPPVAVLPARRPRWKRGRFAAVRPA